MTRFFKEEITKEKEFFRTLLNSFLLSLALQALSRTHKFCLMKKVEVLFIGENSDLKRSFESSILRNFETTSTVWSMKSAEGKFYPPCLLPFFFHGVAFESWCCF